MYKTGVKLLIFLDEVIDTLRERLGHVVQIHVCRLASTRES